MKHFVMDIAVDADSDKVARQPCELLPSPVANYYELSEETIPWRRLGPGIWHYQLPLSDGVEGDLRLLKISAGMKMPEHGHGMNVQPETVEQPDGSYRVKGMLLHMAGYWLLHVDVVEKGLFERTSFRIDLD